MLQAMNTGHDGSMCSVHANASGECFKRLETLYLLAGHDVPIKAIRNQMASAINFIIQLRRNREGERVVHQVAEVAGIEGETILLQDLGVYKDHALQFTGLAAKNFGRLKGAGLDPDFFLSL